MTREEAIKYLKRPIATSTDIGTEISKEFEAYNMAISALEQQRWIPCVDGNEPKANADCWITTNAKYVRRASYAPKATNQPNGFIVTVGSFGFYEYGKSAKAWMPYTKEPEPYREEGD